MKSAFLCLRCIIFKRMNSILKMALFSVLNSDHFKQAKQSGDSGVKHNCSDTTHFLAFFPELYNTVSNVKYIISNSIQLSNCQIYVNQTPKIYVSLRLRVQNAVPAQPCVGKLGISLVLLNFLHCNFRLWFKTP